MPKIDFSKDIYKLLGCVTEEGELLEFPEWDLLKELDRREKRKHRTSESTRKIRAWMKEHSEEVARVLEKRGVDIPTCCPTCRRLNGEHDEGCLNKCSLTTE